MGLFLIQQNLNVQYYILKTQVDLTSSTAHQVNEKLQKKYARIHQAHQQQADFLVFMDTISDLLEADNRLISVKYTAYKPLSITLESKSTRALQGFISHLRCHYIVHIMHIAAKNIPLIAHLEILPLQN